MMYSCGNKRYDLAKRTHIMGVVNCTPDSFYGASRRRTSHEAVKAGAKMVEEGADFLDVGGESSRPGADPVPLEEELARVMPVIEGLAKEVAVPISVDTYKSEVAEKALNAGASLVNDISGLACDDRMAAVVASLKAGVILMHMQGRPKTMQQQPFYRDVVREVADHLRKRAELAGETGIPHEKIIVDPGLGFGKRLQDNYVLLRNLSAIRELGFPVLVGASRKSLVSSVLQLATAECLEGTIAINTIAILNGAQILRVHDVRAAKRAAQIADYYKSDQAD